MLTSIIRNRLFPPNIQLFLCLLFNGGWEISRGDANMVEDTVNVRENFLHPPMPFSRGYPPAGTPKPAFATPRHGYAGAAGLAQARWWRVASGRPAPPRLSVAAALEDQLISLREGLCVQPSSQVLRVEPGVSFSAPTPAHPASHRSAAPRVCRLTAPPAAEGGLCTVTMETLVGRAKSGRGRAGGRGEDAATLGPNLDRWRSGLYPE